MNDTDIKRVESHLKRTFNTGGIQLKAGSRPGGPANVHMKDALIGVVFMDEDDDGSFMFEMGVKSSEAVSLDDAGRKHVESRLNQIFDTGGIHLKARPRQNDSAEVYVGDEFIAVIFKDEDESGAFMFEMAILAEDLSPA